MTGRPPFLGESALETLKLVTSTEVVAPRRLRPDVPRDLETICLKCLEKEPVEALLQRPGLAEDLRRFLEGRPIPRAESALSGRIWRWCRRNPVGRPASIAILVVGTVVSTWQAVRAHRAEAVSPIGGGATITA